LKSIGIIYIGIGEYIKFFEDFYYGAEAFFFSDVEKHYFLISDFTFWDASLFKNKKNIIYVRVRTCSWPWPTLNRFGYVLHLASSGALEKYQNIFFFNANCRFISKVDNSSMLESQLLATLHPGYFDAPRHRFTYESRPESTAYISSDQGFHYFAGGFQGGQTDFFIESYRACYNMLQDDIRAKIIAIWHDESYWNRHIYDLQKIGKTAISIAGPEHLYPIGSQLPFTPKVVLLDKRVIYSTNGTSLHDLKSTRA
jgi:hypothetical protein